MLCVLLFVIIILISSNNPNIHLLSDSTYNKVNFQLLRHADAKIRMISNNKCST